MKTGMTGGRLQLLSESDIERIHQGSLDVLATHGVMCDSQAILDTFRRAGAKVDSDKRVVYLMADLIEAALTAAPKSFVLCGREPEYDINLEAGRIYFGMGGTPEPFFFDNEQQGPRQPTKADMEACTRIGHALPNMDFVMALCSAGDMPEGVQYAHEYDALLRNTTKPIIGSSPGRRQAATFLEMAAAACGGEAELRRRPCCVVFSQPVSPLRFGSYNENIYEAAAFGVPVLSSPGPMMGATSPVSLAGTLVQVNAEALVGIVLSQLIKEGTPVIYAPHTGVMDMATAQCTYGSPEQSLARAAVAQLARFYNLPSFGLGGGVDAKTPDSEAASEAMLGMVLNALSGLTLTQCLGTMASGLYGSAEMAVICDEMVHMIERVLGGITVNDETLAVDLIKAVGHGGSFLETDHTLNLYRQELFFPRLFRRQSIDRWQEAGGERIEKLAHDRVQEILATAEAVALPPGADETLARVLRGALAGGHAA